MGSESPWRKTRRYCPPTRQSISHDNKESPNDFGTHQRSKSSGLIHASNTTRAGPSKDRVTTSSRSDFRSTVARFFMGVGSPSLFASTDFLLAFQFVDDRVQLVEAGVPELA